MERNTRRCISSILSPSLFSVYCLGTRARQRSRYLRFARPPQEKQLIAARKRTIKEKKFLKLSAEVGVVALLLLLLCTIVFREFIWCHPFMYSCDRPIHWPLFVLGIQYKKRPMYWSSTRVLWNLRSLLNFTDIQRKEFYQQWNNRYSACHM